MGKYGPVRSLLVQGIVKYSSLDFECRHITWNSVVQYNIVYGDVLPGEQLDGLVCRAAAEEGRHGVQLSPAEPTNFVDVVVLKIWNQSINLNAWTQIVFALLNQNFFIILLLWT